MAKIVPILKYTAARPLTPLMIKTLRAACKLQRSNEPIGHKELDGSFIALLKRSFIDSKTVIVNGKNEVLWYVTAAGKESLIKLGFNEGC